jgi:hypothetical protein
MPIRIDRRGRHKKVEKLATRFQPQVFRRKFPGVLGRQTRVAAWEWGDMQPGRSGVPCTLGLWRSFADLAGPQIFCRAPNSRIPDRES